MLKSLALKECTVSELAAPHKMSLAAASKHLKVLERATLLSRSVRGRTHICRLNPEPLRRANGWLQFYEHFWTDRLDALKNLLDAQGRGAEEEEEAK
jgi:DNA-binding transcriptional ArsR family regulator